jgi:tryptophan halogenase
MTAAALAAYTSEALHITWIACKPATDADIFYGNLAPPTAYEFNLALGVSEPNLLLESDTAFSYGTHYTAWGARKLDWVQAFHLPLPVLEGVPFHHYLTQQGIEELEPFLISAMAARRGAFAHPPEERNNRLARAEYGYHFDAENYGRLFETSAVQGGISRIEADIVDVNVVDGNIRAVHLSNGQSVTADLWVDATGPQAHLLSRAGAKTLGNRHLAARLVRTETVDTAGGVTVLTGDADGWRAQTPLRSSVLSLTVTDAKTALDLQADDRAVATRSATAMIGRREVAWLGNCVAIGQAACVAEPLTPAPMILLQRDIERLLTLLPVADDMAVERREFNRQAEADHAHAGLFTRALFKTEPPAGSSYWRQASEEPDDERLLRKIEQFESRGLHVAFDLEPFSPEDWLILHYGMKRKPARYDRTADRADRAGVKAYLDSMRREIDGTVRAMPPHDAYLNGLTGYLRQNKG